MTCICHRAKRFSGSHKQEIELRIIIRSGCIFGPGEGNERPIMSLRNLSLAGLLIGVASIVTHLLRHSLFARGVFAQATQVLSLLLMVWARFSIGRRSFHASALPTEGGLVTSGPYRYIRHPISTSILFFVWAGVLSNWAPVELALGALLTTGMVMPIATEEQLVRDRYPEYGDYAARTERIILYVF